MICRLFMMILPLFVYCRLSTFANSIKRTIKDNRQQEKLPKGQELMEIANREYKSVHGRIIAINMATLGKRRLKFSPRPGSTFGNIENVNEGKHLNLYQGDIQLDEDLERYLHMPVRSMTKRNAIRAKKRIWSSKVIPYKIPAFMSYITQNVLAAVAAFNKYTCLRFVPYRPGVHRNYITFHNDKGCSSKVGKSYYKPGSQKVSIGSGCNFIGTIQHELMHAIGFFHEQARSDRDRYVRVNWENILEGFSDQFDKYSWTTIDTLGKSYDYESIMHYDRTAFTKNGNPTIVAIDNEQMEFNKGKQLSAGDIIEINTLYNCKAKRYGWSSWSGFTPCNDKCYKTRERFCYHPGKLTHCGGKTNAYGIEEQKVKCTKRECDKRFAIDGHWGRWSDWSDCSATCDNGMKTRFRKCDKPKPGKYGKPCSGKAKESRICIVRRCHMGYYDTDFEDPYRPLGMWKNKPGAQIKWLRHKGYTGTINTGPSSDHTTGHGYYLYMESSGPADKNYQARLISPPLTTKQGGQCLKFAYLMYGNTMGSLKVITRYNRLSATLFYKSGDQGKLWHMANINLKFPKMPGLKLEIVATVGQPGYSDIAIDDIYIDDGLCSCQDKYIKCVKWAKKGECQKNKKWMSDHCQRSCKTCKDQTSVTTPNKKCIDTNKVQCPLWAKNGECSKNKAWMYKNCAKSCKICQGETCSDKTIHCKAWSKIGECKKNPAYMKLKCKKSCGLCL